jgi:sugar O-acyltransferase (sialic acid O-acetyltransferase NeuD family)
MLSKRLLIVGAGGFGREVLCWARDVESTQSEWKIGGFLDANPAALDGFNVPFRILGDPAEFAPVQTDRYICAIGDPATKQRVITALLGRSARFSTLIHPSVTMGADCRIGVGCILCPSVVLTTNVTLGRFSTLNAASTVGHDAVVGDWCTLSGHVDITGKVILGEAAFVGSHACVLPGLRVGDRAVVGAGTVVTRNVRAGCTAFGVPAKHIFTKATQ